MHAREAGGFGAGAALEAEDSLSRREHTGDVLRDIRSRRDQVPERG